MRKLFGTALVGVVLAVTAAPATAFQSGWGEENIAYTYTLYADAEKTIWIGFASDTCGWGGSVISPNISTPYFDREPAFVCTDMGPYLPPHW